MAQLDDSTKERIKFYTEVFKILAGFLAGTTAGYIALINLPTTSDLHDKLIIAALIIMPALAAGMMVVAKKILDDSK